MADLSAELYGAQPSRPSLADELYGTPARPPVQIQPTEESSFEVGGVGNLIAGGLRGAASIGSTIVAPFQAALAGTGQTGAQQQREKILRDVEEGLVRMGANPESLSYKGGKLGTEIAGTVAVGGIGASSALPLLARTAGGAVGGAAGTAMVDPQDTAMGAGVGAVLPAALKGVGAFSGGLYDMIRGNLSKLRARDIMQDVAGKDVTAIQRALENAPQDITAAQAAAGIPRLEWQALGELARKGDPSAYHKILAAQEAAQQQQLNRMAMGGTAEQTAESISQMGKRLERTQGPFREAQLGEANIGRNIDDLLRQADELDYQAMQFGGTSAQAAQLRQQAQQIADWGYKPLDVSKITGRISNILDDPALGASDRVAAVMRDVAEGINQWVKRGEGVIDANALYMKRKEAINESIEKLLSGADPATTKRLSAKLAGELRPLIDDAIEASGATGWRRMLDKYSQGFEQMERVELLGKLRDLSSDEFIKVVRGQKPEIVQAIMDTKRGVSDALPKPVLDRLRQIASERERDIVMKQQASEATPALSKIVGKDLFGFRLPGFLSAKATVTNATLDAIESRLNRKTMEVISEAMKSGKSANELMKLVPAKERDNVFKWIYLGGPQKFAPALVANQ